MNDVIDKIVTDKDNKTYWVHRASLEPLYINWGTKRNKKSVLLSPDEYFGMSNEDQAFADSIPLDLWQKGEPDYYIDFLLENGITKEAYMKKLKESFLKQLPNFFDRGLFSRELDITRTATRVDDKKDLEKIIKQDYFGFSGGDVLRDTLNHRSSLNILFVLEIPKDCFSFDNFQKLFEISKETLNVDTAYAGYQKIDKIIPSQFIKCAIMDIEGDFITEFNSNYDNKYVIKNGIYDENILDNRLNLICGQPFDYEKAVEILEQNSNNFRYTKDFSSYKYLIDKLLEWVKSSGMKVSKTDKFYKELLSIKEEVRKSMRTPLEKNCEELIDLIKKDKKNVVDGEFVDRIKALLSIANEDLGRDYSSQIKILEDALNAIDENLLDKISTNSSYIGLCKNINLKKKLIEMYNHEVTSYQFIFDKKLFMHENNKDLDIELNNVEIRIHMIQKALTCSNNNVVCKIIDYITKNDVSNFSIMDCDNIIEEILSNEYKKILLPLYGGKYTRRERLYKLFGKDASKLKDIKTDEQEIDAYIELVGLDNLITACDYGEKMNSLNKDKILIIKNIIKNARINRGNNLYWRFSKNRMYSKFEKDDVISYEKSKGKHGISDILDENVTPHGRKM